MKYGYIIIASALLLINCNSKNTEQNKEEKATVEQSPAVTNDHIASAETEPKGPLPTMEFKEKSYDFGTIKEGEKVRHTFEFTNSGEAPLVIQNASASCGCTVPNWPKDPVEVGKTGVIDVEFNSTGKSGPQSKTISITANTHPTITTVNITGVVETKNDDSKGPIKK